MKITKGAWIWLIGGTIISIAIIRGISNNPLYQGTPMETATTDNPTDISADTSTPSSTNTPSTSSTGGRVRTGEQGIIRSDGPFAVGIDKQALGELTDAANANDTIGFASLFYAGRAFELEAGTRVLVLENGWLEVRIRVLEGKQVGRSGWMAYEFVVPIP